MTNQTHVAATGHNTKTRNRITLSFFFFTALAATTFTAPKAHAGCPGHPSSCSKSISLGACDTALSLNLAKNPYDMVVLFPGTNIAIPTPPAPPLNPNWVIWVDNAAITATLCDASALTCPCP